MGGYVKLITSDLLETALIPGNPCTVKIWIKANLAIGQVRIRSFNGSTAAKSNLTLSNEWQEHTLTFIPATGDNYWIRFANISAATDPYVDDITVTQTFGKINNDFSGTDTEMLSDFSLLGNFPNPFNPSTTISYALPFQSQVELKIYDIMGAEVRSFNLPSQSAGYQSIFWDGRNNHGEAVSSGIYLYRLSLKSQESNKVFVKTAKLVMLK
jgi:hypothetical protein